MRVGQWLRFGDGSNAYVYRETLLTGPPRPIQPFSWWASRLRAVRVRGHAVFRPMSLLNTPLFVGLPGFVSKLWLANDEPGIYRGSTSGMDFSKSRTNREPCGLSWRWSALRAPSTPECYPVCGATTRLTIRGLSPVTKPVPGGD